MLPSDRGTLKNGVKIGRDISFEEIRKRADATVIAIGAWKSSGVGCPGEDQQGVLGGIDFLREVSLGNAPDIGKKVAVVGGGNTAMDACRTAVRLGAEEVYVVYRRTRNEMPAEDIEIEEAMEEGVTFKFLTNPAEILGENGRVKAVKLQVMELGEPDASGRRSPVPVEGKFETLEVDCLLYTSCCRGWRPHRSPFSEGPRRSGWPRAWCGRTQACSQWARSAADDRAASACWPCPHSRASA